MQEITRDEIRAAQLLSDDAEEAMAEIEEAMAKPEVEAVCIVPWDATAKASLSKKAKTKKRKARKAKRAQSRNARRKR